MTRPYQVIRFDDCGESKILASYATYEAADESLNKWDNRFPYAYIDIHNKNETND